MPNYIMHILSLIHRRHIVVFVFHSVPFHAEEDNTHKQNKKTVAG